MDANGRLHMPGFVGQTFEETGVEAEQAKAVEDQPMNRKARRAAEALERRAKESTNGH